MVLGFALVLIVTTHGYASACAASTGNLRPQRVYSHSEKGVLMDVHIVLDGALGGPSLSDLKQSRFTLVGTCVYSWFTVNNWNALAAWVAAVHREGLRTFVMLWSEAGTAAAWTSRAASIGVDVVILDELINRYNVTKPQLQSIIQAGLSAKSSLLFIVTEYMRQNVVSAYEWTAEYRCVRVATDNYAHLEIADLGIQLASQYGKRPFAWLMFSSDSTRDLQNACYQNLDTWLTHMKQNEIDPLFYYVDSSGAWKTTWASTSNF